jgi:SEC-C motif domain protein
MKCPCCSGGLYSECCEPFHLNQALPKMPEQLMRSRYSAFYLHLADYLLATSHSSLQKLQSKKSILEWAQENEWVKLEVLHTNDKQVEFKAHFKDKEGSPQVHHELSDFALEKGKWLYKSGEIDPPVKAHIKRNDPCPCGSGKKYKKCCG